VADIDTDHDTNLDCNDVDDDNDGVLDTEDVFPLDATETMDTDEDGIGNNADPDDDNDGISDVIESEGSNNGDANGDGTQDSLQQNVAGIASFTGKGYVIIESPGDTILSGCQATTNPSPGDAPSNINFDYGFFNFTISGLTSGGSTHLTITLPSGTTPVTYYKYGRTPSNQVDHWYEFKYNNEIGAEINGNIITLHFVDALRGDDKLMIDSMVVDLGGPGFKITDDDDSGDTGDDTKDDADTGGGGGGGCFLLTLF
jgi:hypothetical protein